MGLFFPKYHIDKGERVAIYGLGFVGQYFVNYIKEEDYCDIVFGIDKNKENLGNKYDFEIYDISQVDKEMINSIDKILVASIIDDIKSEIQEQLFQLGVEKSKIVCCDFYEYDKAIYYDSFADKQEVIDSVYLQVIGVPQFIEKTQRAKEFYEYRNLFLEPMDTRWNNQKDITRIIFLWTNLEAVLQEASGAVAELGVFQGSTAAVFERIATKYGRELYLFDTFEGFNTDDLVDIDQQVGRGFENTTLERVKSFVGDKPSIHYLEGYFPDSLKNEPIDDVSYAFVHIDCDLYKPILAGLLYFSKHLCERGMIVVHDYYSGYWDGAKKAIDEFLNENNEFRKVLIPDLSGSVAIVKS